MALRLAFLIAAALTARTAGAQDAPRLDPTAPRVLFAVSDSVKTDDGRHARITTIVRYDPGAGTYVHTTEDARGRTLSRAVRRMTVAGPTEAEDATAQALVAAHPDIAGLVADAAHPVLIQGGFPLVRESGACGPGSRCLSYDVVEIAPGGARRIRYVVVDLREVRVVSADADPVADGNLAHPAARRQSRSW